jgi:hypothetical protein
MADLDRLTLEGVLAAFEEHLRRTRGVCVGTRRNYARYVTEFFVMMFGGGAVELAEIQARDVIGFIGGLSGPTGRGRPSSLRRRCARSSGSCVRLGYVRTGWRTRCR